MSLVYVFKVENDNIEEYKSVVNLFLSKGFNVNPIASKTNNNIYIQLELDPKLIPTKKKDATIAEKINFQYYLIASTPSKVINRDNLFVPHDREFNKQWVKTWTHNFLLTRNDINNIRDYLGEKTAFYFAFLQFYLKSLIVPSIVCIFAPAYSLYFAGFILLWAVIAVNLWERHEVQYASEWGTTGFSRIEHVRPDFYYWSEKVDPNTGYSEPYYPISLTISKMVFVSFPVILASSIFIGIAIVLNLAIEVFVSKIYAGPFKELVALIPSILYAISIPTLLSLYNSLMKGLTRFENRKTETEYQFALAQKTFLVLGMIGFLNLFLVAFGFIPFHDWFINLFMSIGIVDGSGSVNRFIGPEMFTERLIYFVVTGQVLNAVQELILPLLLPKAKALVKSKINKTSSKDSKEALSVQDETLEKLEHEYSLPEFTEFDDYVEMITQFGFIALFSVAWPYTPLVCLINNFFELRSDAIKIAETMRRPIPHRHETIGPWKNIMKQITWMGAFSLTSLSIVYGDWDPNRSASEQTFAKTAKLVVSCFIAERLYFILNWFTSWCLTLTKKERLAKEVDDGIVKRRFGGDVIIRPPSMIFDKNTSVVLDGKKKVDEKKEQGISGDPFRWDDSIQYGVALGEYYGLSNRLKSANTKKKME